MGQMRKKNSLKKWMYAIHIGHIRKPKQLKKNTILKKEFNLPKKKEFVKKTYIYAMNS